MSRFELTEGVNGLPKIILEGNEQSCEIYLYGCTITSWKVRGVEKLFVSELAVFDGVKAIRGGIPLVFPQFGQPDTIMPQHGFARTSEWEIYKTNVNERSCVLVFSLSESPATLAVWPHKFTLFYTITFDSVGMTTALDIVNTDDSSSFDCQALLHTYLRVSDINSTSVTGFHGRKYIDKMSNSDIFLDSREIATIGEEVDRIYCGNSDSDETCKAFQIKVLQSGAVVSDVSIDAFMTNTLGNLSHRIMADCVLWNAWINKSKAISDLNDDAYNHYVCVEPGLVAGYTSVAPLHTLTLSQTLLK